MATKQSTADPFKRQKTSHKGVSRRLLKDGSYRYYVWTPQTGHRAVPDGGGEAEAILYLAQLRLHAANGEEPSVNSSSKQRMFEQVAEEWFDSKRKLSRSTRDSYRVILDRILLPRFDGRKIGSISMIDITSLMISLEQDGLRSDTIKRYTQPLRSVLAFAASRKYRADNPWLLLTPDDFPAPSKRKEEHVWSDDDAEALIRAAKSRGRRQESRYDYTDLVTASLYLGVRQSEALGLTWHDVVLKEPAIYVRQQWCRYKEYGDPKTQSGVRRIPLPDHLVAMFKRMKERALARGLAAPEQPVFISRNDMPLGHRSVSRGFARVAEDAGLDISWHDMRDYFASRLIHRGIPVTTIAAWMGHADASITLKRYARIFDRVKSDEQGKEALAR